MSKVVWLIAGLVLSLPAGATMAGNAGNGITCGPFGNCTNFDGSPNRLMEYINGPLYQQAVAQHGEMVNYDIQGIYNRMLYSRPIPAMMVPPYSRSSYFPTAVGF